METIIRVSEGVAEVALVQNFVGNVALSGGLNYLWGCVNCLQIVAHFPMINVLMPANAQELFRHIVKVATFDLVNVDGVMELIASTLPTAADSFDLPENFHAFEYTSSDPV